MFLPKSLPLPEIAKQRELSGTLESEAEAEARLKKQLSDAKYKELSRNDIFAPQPKILPRPLASPTLAMRENFNMGDTASHTVNTSVRVSNSAGGQSNITSGDEPVIKPAKKIYNQKFTELSGNDIFQGDVPPAFQQHGLGRVFADGNSLSCTREMSRNDIFADGKVESREYLGGVCKPPGGESSMALV